TSFDTDGISAIGVQKITIDGPGTLTSFQFAISWGNVTKSDVSDVTASRNVAGFGIGGGSDDDTFTGNVVSDNIRAGIFVVGATNCTFETNVVNNNPGNNGITLAIGGGHKLRRNTVNGNGFDIPPCAGGGIAIDGSGNEITQN